MSNKDPIEVMQTANGFLVRPAFREQGRMTMQDEMRVFQSFAELTLWLSSHFDHRATAIQADVAPSNDRNSSDSPAGDVRSNAG